MKKEIHILLTIIFVSLLSSCGALVKGLALNSYTVEKGAIPPDFGKDDSILICVLSGQKNRDKHLKKHVEKIYNGKYVFVSSGDMPFFVNQEKTSNEYSDTEKYRYVFDFRKSSTTSFTPNPITKGTDVGTVKSSNYFVIDRQLNKTYNSGSTSGIFSKLIQAYMIRLEEQRVKNQ